MAKNAEQLKIENREIAYSYFQLRSIFDCSIAQDRRGLSPSAKEEGKRMPYDSSLDERLFSKTWEDETKRLTVSIWAYNKGAKKLQIARENRDAQGDFRFARLGRLTKEEAEAVLPLYQEAIKHM